MKYFLLVCLVLGVRAEEAKLYLQPGHSSYVTAVAFSPDARFVLSGGLDGARLWDAGRCGSPGVPAPSCKQTNQ